jgi:hypothetical protein
MYTYEESDSQSHLRLSKDSNQNSPFHFSNKSCLPSGELSITKKGHKLCLRPLSPYRYNPTPEIKEDSSSESIEISEEDIHCHQRSSTTIINDVAQSYTFVPAIKKTQGSMHEEEILSNVSIENLENFKNSIMASTADPKSFFKKSKVNQQRNSTILTISSNSSVKSLPLLQSKDDKNNKESQKNSILEPVTAFCKKCGENNPTEVIEKIYTGSL